ncbi:MAG: hypothetical protein ABWY78_14865 [Microvirga sp.]
MLWHIHDRGETRRLPGDAIRNGLTGQSISREALVWVQGMPHWRPASQVFGSEPIQAELSPQPCPVRRPPIPTPIPIPILLFAILATAGASALEMIHRSFAYQTLKTAVDIGAAISLLAIGLFATAVLGAALMYCTWGHPARHKAAGYAGLVFIISIIALVFEGTNAASTIASSMDRYRIELAREAKPDAVLTLTENDDISIVGPIGSNLMRHFMAFETAYGPITSIEITSEGGLLDQALELAEYIEKHKLTVIVREKCLSACTVIAVASPESYAEADAVFGFHQSSSLIELRSELSVSGSKAARQYFNDFLRNHRVPQSVLDEGAKHSPASMYLVPASKMAEYGTIRIRETKDDAEDEDDD